MAWIITGDSTPCPLQRPHERVQCGNWSWEALALLHSPLGLTSPHNSQVCFQGRGLMSPINSVGTGHPLRARLCAGAQNAWKKETQSRPRGLSRDRQDIS